MVKGRVVVSNGELDDLIIARSDGTPTYNFCVVVDDWDMNITHVIRGDDHLNNTPRQINILKALNAPLPQYAHVPMILGHDGERLSKRHGAVSVMQYLEDGYLPEALLNYLARLGWAHGDEEVFDLDQFVEWFDLDAISKSPAKFNPEKLLWLNQQYLKKTDSKRLSELVLPFLETDLLQPRNRAAHGRRHRPAQGAGQHRRRACRRRRVFLPAIDALARTDGRAPHAGNHSGNP